VKRPLLYFLAACVAAFGVIFVFSNGEETAVSAVDPPSIEAAKIELQEALGGSSEVDTPASDAKPMREREPDGVHRAQVARRAPTKGRAIRGRVTAAGEGVAGATVEFFEAWRPSVAATLVTNAAGEFEIDLAGREFEWSQFSPKALRVTTADQASFSYPIRVRDGQGDFTLKLPSWRGELYTACIIDRDTQAPRAGVPLEFISEGEFGRSYSLMTDGSGFIRFSSRSAGSLRALHGALSGEVGLRPGASPQTLLFHGVPEYAELTAVDSTTGERIADVEWESISRMSIDRGLLWSWRASDHPAETACAFVVKAPGYITRRLICEQSTKGELIEVPLVSEFDVAMPDRIRVLAAGRPVVGAAISIFPDASEAQVLGSDSESYVPILRSDDFVGVTPRLAGKTNDQGEFLLDAREFWGRFAPNLAEINIRHANLGKHVYRASETAILGRDVIEVEITPPTATLVFQVSANRGAVAVQVLDSDRSKPTRSSPISDLRLEPGERQEVSVPAGIQLNWRYSVQGSWEHSLDDILLQAGEVHRIEILPDERLEVSGVLVDERGHPVNETLQLELYRLDENGQAQAVVEDWGRVMVGTGFGQPKNSFQFTRVPEGRYELRVRGYSDVLEPILVNAGDTEVRVSVPALCTLVLEVTDLNGNLEVDLSGSIVAQEGGLREFISEGVCEFSFWPGIQKSCWITARDRELTVIDLPKQMPAGNVIRKRVALRPGRQVAIRDVPAEVSGNLDAEATRVFVRSAWLRGGFLQSDSGDLIFYGLPIDAVEVEFRSKDGETWRRTIEAGLEEVAW